MSVDQVRRLTMAALCGMTTGINPNIEKKKIAVQHITLNKAFKDFFEAKRSLVPSTVDSYDCTRDLYLKDQRRKPITSITRHMVLITRRSSTRRAPGWFLGSRGLIAAHAPSESQNSPAIAPPLLVFTSRIRTMPTLQYLDWVSTLTFLERNWRSTPTYIATTSAAWSSVATRFGVAPSSVVKWTQRAARTGSVRPAKMGGYRRPVLESHRDWLLDQVRNRPHVTLSALQDLLAERGVIVSHDTVWRFLRGCGFSFKKRRWSPTNGSARM